MTGIFSISVLMYKALTHSRRYFAFFITCMAMALCLEGQETELHFRQAEQILSARGELIISFKKPAGISLDSITLMVSIDRIDHDTITAYVNRAQYDHLLTYGIPFSLKPFSPVFTMERKTADWHERYPAYTEYGKLMRDFAIDNPPIAHLWEIGETPGGHKMLVMHISGYNNTGKPKPTVFLTSSIHGDELVGYNLMLRLISLLLSHYDDDLSIRRLIDSTDIWINPLANPDGTFYLSDTSVAGATRFNLNSTDLNRNFPDPVKGDHPDAKEWQAETVIMMNFMKSIHPDLSVNFHGGSELVNYPWDAFKELHPDDEWFKYISRGYADTAHVYSYNGYMTEQDKGITNGYAWYTVYGGRQDYVTYFLRGREVTIELSEVKTPAENLLESYWQYNYRSIIQYIGKVNTGIRGTVTDSLTGAPVPAQIHIAGHDHTHSEVFADSADAVFYRFLLPGTYELDFIFAGYEPKRTNVKVADGYLTHMNIKLHASKQISYYPNPFSDLLRIYIPDPGKDLVISFTDITGRATSRIIQHIISPGWQDINVNGLSPGNYIINITYGNLSARDKVVKIR